MSVLNTEIIDGMGLTNGETILTLLLSDHLDWNNESQHLLVLQDKINSYVSFIESEQFKINYPSIQFKGALIDVRFKYDIPINCEKFLQTAQNQIGHMGIKIQATISK